MFKFIRISFHENAHILNKTNAFFLLKIFMVLASLFHINFYHLLRMNELMCLLKYI